ncbi:MAG: chemotaxis protein CheA [Deltaproteobacteria bacterium]|nr:chemotaxis protein CheA [Deltaproteobacteria bacterium]
MSNLETIGLKDGDAWNGIEGDLKELVSDVAGEMPLVTDPLNHCLKGIRLLSENAVASPLLLVDSISECLYAFQQCLLDKPGMSELMLETGQELERVLVGLSKDELTASDSKAVDETTGTAELSDITINDAAALLVLLEADDTEALTRLKGLFDAIVAGGTYSRISNEKLRKAATKTGDILSSKESDPDQTIKEIGVLLDEAVNAKDDEEGSDASDGTSETHMENVEAAISSESDKVEESSAMTAIPDPVQKEGDVQKEAPGQKSVHSESLPADADFDLLSEFVAESGDLISDAEEALLTLETDPGDEEAVGMIFRAFHTVKGVSAFLELNAISEMAHFAESLLSRVRDKEIRYAGGYADLALRSLDMIKQMITFVQEALGGAPLLEPEGYDDLIELLRDPEGAGISDETGMEEDVTPRIGDILVAGGKAKREDVEALAESKSGKPIGVEIAQKNAAKVSDVAQALRTQDRMKGKQVFETSVRVSTGRLDRLVDMVGELVIAHSMVAQDELVVGGDQHQLLKKVNQTGKIVRELQDLGMSMRMIPLKGTFKKMTRLVRDLSRKVGKNVKLVTHGEDTEIDRNMVDVINDPLMHMVRNAVDHGIETAEARAATGKPAAGTVTLSAYHAAGSVVVEIQDDGKGISRDVILKKGRERGLVTDGSALNDREIFNLIFEPGFSTAEAVTDVSGRGVGMDVVKKNIESIRGQVEIQSEMGRGSVFKMRLPLTLAIIDGMALRVNQEAYIIPTGSIVRSIKPGPESISTVLQKGEMASLRGELIPVFRLHELFAIEMDEDKQDNQLIVVVEDDNKRQAGLIIDELIGRQQIVIKPLGDAMRDIPGISGGAIMPNGQVGLILDVGGIMQLANS